MCRQEHVFGLLSVCMLMLIPAISWSLFSVWPWPDSQSAMYRSGIGLYNMSTLYHWICSIMHGSLCDRVAMCVCWPLPLMVFVLLLHLPPRWKSSGWISPDHVVCQGPLALCCYITTLGWIECNRAQCCVVQNLISITVHNVSYL